MGDGRRTAELGYCLVTGGAGFLGRNLAYELVRRGHRVRVFDRAPIGYAHERLDVQRGDIRSYEDVRKACEGIDCVFHTAALLDFVGFASRRRRERSHAVNVGGVENLVAACVDAGVRRLVHTSSNNVTFGDPVIDGDESRPYAAPKDLYTETKIEGERAALRADGLGDLHTCAIRPGGIYGPGEKLMLARVVEECASGRFVATIGDGTALSDNTYVENLVDAQIEAARHLVPGSPVCGQAYFVTDGHPINYFEFFRPIVEDLGFRFPVLRVPAGLLHPVVWIWERLHCAVGIPPPFLTRLELRKISVSHYNRIDKARRDFGWRPKVGVAEAMDECLAYCRDLLAARERVERPHWGWWVAARHGDARLAGARRPGLRLVVRARHGRRPALGPGGGLRLGAGRARPQGAAGGPAGRARRAPGHVGGLGLADPAARLRLPLAPAPAHRPARAFRSRLAGGRAQRQ